MQNEMKIFVTNLDKKKITNKNTGEVRDYCMVTFLVAKEETSNSKGTAQLTCYCKPEAWTILDKYMFKWVSATMNNIVENNRLKVKIKQVDEAILS